MCSSPSLVQGDTALLVASKRGHVEAIKVITLSGGNIMDTNLPQNQEKVRTVMAHHVHKTMEHIEQQSGDKNVAKANETSQSHGPHLSFHKVQQDLKLNSDDSIKCSKRAPKGDNKEEESDGFTALSWAAQRGDMASLRALFLGLPSQLDRERALKHKTRAGRK